jgi:hypothetical protein
MVGGFKHVLFSIICWDTPSHRLSYIFQDGFCTTNLLFFLVPHGTPNIFHGPKSPKTNNLAIRTVISFRVAQKFHFPPEQTEPFPLFRIFTIWL